VWTRAHARTDTDIHTHIYTHTDAVKLEGGTENPLSGRSGSNSSLHSSYCHLEGQALHLLPSSTPPPLGQDEHVTFQGSRDGCTVLVTTHELPLVDELLQQCSGACNSSVFSLGSKVRTLARRGFRCRSCLKPTCESQLFCFTLTYESHTHSWLCSSHMLVCWLSCVTSLQHQSMCSRECFHEA
jgi:hypothetical protein